MKFKKMVLTKFFVYYDIIVYGKVRHKRKSVFVLMATFHTFPTELELLSAYFVYATSYVNAQAHLAVSPLKLAVLNGLMNTDAINWTATYPLSIGANATHNARVRRHTLIGLIEKCLLDIYDNIPLDLWTSDDRNNLRRPLKATTHTHSTAYANAPTLSLVLIQHLATTIRLLDGSHPDSQHLPAKQMIHLENYVGKAGILDADIPWGEGEAVTHFLDTEHFTDAQVGMTLYQHACYE